MRIYKRKVKIKENEQISQYPMVQKYKYLGVVLSNNLDFREHIKAAVVKSAYIRSRLYCIRRINSLKANINLFRVLIVPNIRMVAACYDFQPQHTQDTIQRTIRVELKKFCLLPQGMENELVEAIFGNIHDSLNTIASNSQLKLYLRMNGIITDAKRIVSPASKVKIALPPKLNKIIRRIYSYKTCPVHGEATLCKRHLAEGHGIRINIRELVNQYQKDEERGRIREKVLRLLRDLKSIQTKD